MLRDPLAIVVVLFGVILVSLKLTDRFLWARKISTVMWILALAAVLSNLGLIPIEATVALGQIRAINRLEGAWELGHLAFYVFFAAVGAMISIYNAVVLSPILFAYVMIIIAIHMLVIYGLGRAMKIGVDVLTVASIAAKAGPALVLAITETKGWKQLSLPGLVMGLVGYAVGNYVGFGVAYLLKALVGA